MKLKLFEKVCLKLKKITLNEDVKSFLSLFNIESSLVPVFFINSFPDIFVLTKYSYPFS